MDNPLFVWYNQSNYKEISKFARSAYISWCWSCGHYIRLFSRRVRMIYINMDSVSLASQVTSLKEAVMTRGGTLHTHWGNFALVFFISHNLFFMRTGCRDH